MFRELNKKINAYKTKAKIGFLITGLAFLMFFPVMTSLGPAGFIVIVIPFFGGFIYAAKNNQQINLLSQQFKEKYVIPELKKILPDANYRMHGGFSEQEVVDSGLLRKQDRFHSEDMIEGTYDGVAFKCSDVKQEDVSTDSKGHSHTTTVFLGRFFKFEFPKSFQHPIIITQPSLFPALFKSRFVETESIAFNSELKVYAEDKQRAFYLLTPAFMERLLSLDHYFKDQISFSFVDNNLYIAINNRKNTFEFNIRREIDESIFYEYQQEFIHIIKIIETLNMNKDIFGE